MRRVSFDAARDQRVAAEAGNSDCVADGCPNAASVYPGVLSLAGYSVRGMCSAHAWVDRHLWPQVTVEQQDAVRRPRAVPPPAARVAAEEKRAILARLREAVGSRTGRDWAHRLQERHHSGERLTAAQVEAYRCVTGTLQAAGEEAENLYGPGGRYA